MVMKIEGGEITRKNKVAGKRALARVSKQARVQERACNTINLTILQTIVFSDASDEFSLLGKLLVIIESCLPQSFGCSMLVFFCSMVECTKRLTRISVPRIFLFFFAAAVVCFFCMRHSHNVNIYQQKGKGNRGKSVYTYNILSC